MACYGSALPCFTLRPYIPIFLYSYIPRLVFALTLDVIRKFSSLSQFWDFGLLYYFLTGKLLINLWPLLFRNCLSPPSCRRTMHKCVKEIPLFVGHLTYSPPNPPHKFQMWVLTVLFHFSHVSYRTLHRPPLPLLISQPTVNIWPTS